MVGGSVRLRGALLLATSASIAPSASAGAWSLAAGEQQWFATVSRESGDFGQSWRADDFTEIGLGDGWGLNAKIESQIRIGDTYDDRSGYRLGVQKAFALGDRGSVSVQASFLGGESLDGPECIGEGFVNVEAGQRSRGDCDRTVYEVATGIEFVPSWNFGLKAWQDGGANGSTKAEVNLSHDFGLLAVGVGWREEVSGNFSEKGWVLSAQARF